jgi:hypothetical protein
VDSGHDRPFGELLRRHEHNFHGGNEPRRPPIPAIPKGEVGCGVDRLECGAILRSRARRPRPQPSLDRVVAGRGVEIEIGVRRIDGLGPFLLFLPLPGAESAPGGRFLEVLGGRRKEEGEEEVLVLS